MKGEAARELYDNATELLDEIVAGKLLQARGVYGFWPAQAEGDDIVLGNGVRFPMLRQQADHGDERPNRSLADFVAPAETGLPDHIGAFAVTAGIGAEELAARYDAENDPYRSIMVKALADRLAEAFAEYVHELARREWYETGPPLPREELIAERFRGIRPAFGYPACPDHSEKETLFDLLGARELGIELTETFAMTPAASVSGIYLGHPAAKYFSVGRVGSDQVSDYAARKGIDAEHGRAARRFSLAAAVPSAILARSLSGDFFHEDDAEERRESRDDERHACRSARPPHPHVALRAAPAAHRSDHRARLHVGDRRRCSSSSAGSPVGRGSGPRTPSR